MLKLQYSCHISAVLNKKHIFYIHDSIMNTFIERAHRSISRSGSENITRVLKHIRSTSNAIFQLYQLTLQTFTLLSLSFSLYLSLELSRNFLFRLHLHADFASTARR